MNVLKANCDNAGPSSAHHVEFCNPEEEKSCTNLTDEEEDEEETPPAGEPEEVPVHVISKANLKGGKIEECAKSISAYKQLGQALRANNFPGLPVPMQTLSQETYTKEVNQKGLLEKSQSPHWHGKKTDDLGIWRQTFLAHASLNQDLQQYLDSQRIPARTCGVPRPVRQAQQPAAQQKMVKQPPVRKRHTHRARQPAPPPPTDIQTVSENDNDNFWDFYDQPIVPI
ncbi:ciliary microtubule inner protein 4 isoform X1 [Pleurodeles waltl]